MTSKQSELRTQAVEDTTIIGIPNKYMDLWMTKYQSWKNFIMQTYDRKMIEMVKVIDSIAFESMDVRLRRYLETRQHTSESDFIEVTHQEIANDLNASREAVSRLLKKLETNGEVELGRNQVRFLI
jgi:CRP/FNR family transcriptional regulator